MERLARQYRKLIKALPDYEVRQGFRGDAIGHGVKGNVIVIKRGGRISDLAAPWGVLLGDPAGTKRGSDVAMLKSLREDWNDAYP